MPQLTTEQVVARINALPPHLMVQAAECAALVLPKRDVSRREASSTAEALAQIAGIWVPHPGPQTEFVQSAVDDVLYGGARGGAKTDGLIGAHLVHAERYGKHSRGLILRRSFPELTEIIDRTRDLFPRLRAHYNVNDKVWTFPNGARIRLGYMGNEADADNYLGHQYTLISVDQLELWPSLRGLDKLRACLRSTENVPCHFRASANPGGPGHNLVKRRYVDPAPPMTPFVACAQCDLRYDDGVPKCHCQPAAAVSRIYIPSTLDDNPSLRSDTNYWQRVVAAASGNRALLEAWRYGNWDIIAGGFFDDLYRREIHVVRPFPIPSSWLIRRAFDWGSSKPFSVGIWAHSNGDPFDIPGVGRRVYPKGTRFRIAEWYGCSGKPNEGLRMSEREVARGILEREQRLGLLGRVRKGPADPAIFAEEGKHCIATEFAQASFPEFAGQRVRWVEGSRKKGRKQGWALLRGMLKAGLEYPLESPGLFVFEHCTDWIRTVPVLPRDEKDWDDVNTEAEDHCGDETRYEIAEDVLTGGVAEAVGF